MGMIVLVMAALLHVSKVEWMVILILIFLMHSLEMVNTAIEKAVDLSTPDYHPLAKLAKDLVRGPCCFLPSVRHYRLDHFHTENSAIF